MKLMTTLGLATLLAASSPSYAQAPAPAAKPGTVVVTNGMVKALKDMLAAMQAEKMMRTVAGTSRYASAEQQNAVFAKLDKVPAAEIHARLAYPLAKVISVETANEMARFFNSSYGKKVVYAMYNSSGGYGEPSGPVPTPAERKELKNPAYLKAKKEFDAAEPAIQAEAFKLLQTISKK
ncbi:hypothetical protein KY495_15240 [Massilia sp. PAMC28688]|uniref:hypothetical protein n=1 Tax=Massilia sp. PAMC28688 TaxID=2861283 RepID=UPI001C626A20|nr:hypothetical protein [Massilia sp. PAMC28688]QYF92117.1 hypothetical protein KY495_15240 [Massilia sp. PAMC28688]